MYIYIYIYIERERECMCIYIYIYTVSRSDSHWRKQRVLNMFGVQWPQSLSNLKSMTCARCALRLSNAAVCERFQSIYRLLTDPSMSGAMADPNIRWKYCPPWQNAVHHYMWRTEPFALWRSWRGKCLGWIQASSHVPPGP